MTGDARPSGPPDWHDAGVPQQTAGQATRPAPAGERLRGPQEIGPDLAPPSYIEYQDAPWLRTFLRPLLIVLLATCLAAGPLAMLRVLTPWRLNFVMPLLALAAAQGVYSTAQRGRPRWRDRRGMATRLGELLGLMVLLRLAQWVFVTGLPGPSTLASWVHDPQMFLDDQFLVLGLLVLLSWGFAVRMAGDFQDLALQADEYAAQQPRKWDESASTIRAGQPVARSQVLNGIAQRWAFGGMLLLFTAAVTRVSVTADPKTILHVGLLGAGLSPGVIFALVVYFLSGFLLISQARLAVLRAGWFNQSIPVAAPLLRRWHATGLLTVLGVGVLAALLPLGSTLGLAVVLEIVLGLFMRIMTLLFGLSLLLFALLMYPLRGLFGQSPQAPPPRLDLNQVQRQEPVANLPPWLPGALFWVVAALVIGYLLLAFLRAQDRLPGASGRWPGLRYWWRARWQRVRQVVQASRTRLRLRLGRLRRPGGVRGGAREPGPATLTPRGQVRYFYLAALRRAAEQGMGRPPERTPLEFARDLRAQWPSAEEDLDALTGAFVEARYDSRPIEAGRAQGVQAVWRRAMRALNRRSSEPSAPKDMED